MNENSATVASAGTESGMTIRHQIPSEEQPSRRAASSSSIGSVMKNCRSRKMQKALPNRDGTIRGLSVFTHPSSLKRMNSGIRVTSLGNISVESTTTNSAPRKRNRRRANPNATNEDTSVLATVVETEVSRELRVNAPNGRAFHASTSFVRRGVIGCRTRSFLCPMGPVVVELTCDGVLAQRREYLASE